MWLGWQAGSGLSCFLSDLTCSVLNYATSPCGQCSFEIDKNFYLQNLNNWVCWDRRCKCLQLKEENMEPTTLQVPSGHADIDKHDSKKKKSGKSQFPPIPISQLSAGSKGIGRSISPEMFSDAVTHEESETEPPHLHTARVKERRASAVDVFRVTDRIDGISVDIIMPDSPRRLESITSPRGLTSQPQGPLASPRRLDSPRKVESASRRTSMTLISSATGETPANSSSHPA